MRLFVLTAAAVLASVAPAAADVKATANPNASGQPTSLAFDFDATGVGFTGRYPSQLSVSLQPGFTVDPVAIASRCTPDQGAQGTCPADAKVGSVNVQALVAGVPVTFPLGLYLGAPQQPSDVAAIIGSGPAYGTTLSAVGRLFVAGDRLQVSVTLPPAFSPPGGSVFVQHVNETIDLVTRDVVTTTKTKKRVRVKPKHKKKHAKKKFKTIVVTHETHTPHAWLVAPGTCGGAWATEMIVTFADGPSPSPQDSYIPCT